MLWGYGPAVDILSEISEVKSIAEQDQLNILVVGSADGRHILQTIAKYYTHPKKKINFYVVELLIDLVARQLLLILTALEPSEKLGLFEKTRLWMELYGNTVIRPNSSKYLVKQAYQLVHMVTNAGYLSFRLPIVDLSLMKYKERDALETIFQFWCQNKFNIVSLWDGRLRQALGVRYDTRDGVFDWDYYMRVKEIPEGGRINPREYKHWRSSGIAFTWLECEVAEPNPTLASGVAKLGQRLLHHGYLGDILSSPYVNFGLDCEDKELLKTTNGIYAHRATDIAEVNLTRMLHEIYQQKEYKHILKSDRELGVVITEVTDVTKLPEGGQEEESHKDEDYNKKEDYTSLPVHDTKICFLPTSSLVDTPKKPNYKNFFDVIMVSQNLVQRLSPEVMTMVKDGGVLLMETKKFLTSAKKEKEEFGKYLMSLAKERGCRPLKPVDGLTDYLGKFQVMRNI